MNRIYYREGKYKAFIIDTEKEQSVLEKAGLTAVYILASIELHIFG